MFGVWFLMLLLLLGVLVAPIFLLVRLSALRRRVEWLESEVEQLRAGSVVVQPVTSADEVAPITAAPAEAASEAPRPAEPWPPLPPDLRDWVAPSAAPPPTPEPQPVPQLAHATESPDLEQLVGGLWMQNIGAVMLLLGIFLMIVWGYTTGRVGPSALVVSGSLLGLVLSWHGSRVARRTPRFGQALIGVGLGVVYLTLYVGYIRLHVLGPWLAIVLLVLVSLGAILTGLRTRVQTIAVFGVIGAFLPQFMARWLGMPGFEISPSFLLGYLAAIDLLVFALAARAGWSGLDLMAVLLTALTWMLAFSRPEWGWNEQLGLSALFTVLALAPLPRLAHIEGRLRPIDIAVVAMSPLAMIGASAPFLAYAERTPVAMLFFALAAITFGAALWVDLRRPERDLWVPLTAAATLYLAAALERSTGPIYTALAWSCEGAVLVMLGLRARGGWLRALGHLILFASTFVWMIGLDSPAWSTSEWPLFHPAGIRALLCIAAILSVAFALGRGRVHLTETEKQSPELWTIAGQLLLAIWLAREADHFALALTSAGGRFDPLPPPVGVLWTDRRDALSVGFATVAWLLQAAVMAWRGSRGPLLLRIASMGFGFVALVRLCVRGGQGWWLDQLPILHASSLLYLFAVAIMMAIAVRHARYRDRLSPEEGRIPELWATAASLLLMLWSMREAAHVATAMLRSDSLPTTFIAPELLRREHALAAAMASAAWLAQAVVLLLVGWRRESAFVRWSGLGLIGLTLLKFVAFDLQTVDVFWRFVTAIAVGAAMLAFSYAYQRRTRVDHTKGDRR